MKNKAAQQLGRLGGKVKSEAKAETARENGAKGGAPRKKRVFFRLVEANAGDYLSHRLELAEEPDAEFFIKISEGDKLAPATFGDVYLWRDGRAYTPQNYFRSFANISFFDDGGQSITYRLHDA